MITLQIKGFYRRWNCGKDDFDKFPLDKKQHTYTMEYNPFTLLEEIDAFYRGAVSAVSEYNLRPIFLEAHGCVDDIKQLKDGDCVTIHYIYQK
jgi:hypothetical protein